MEELNQSECRYFQVLGDTHPDLDEGPDTVVSQLGLQAGRHHEPLLFSVVLGTAGLVRDLEVVLLCDLTDHVEIRQVKCHRRGGLWALNLIIWRQIRVINGGHCLY